MRENGLAELAKKYGKEFEIDENTNHYSKEDFLKARRGYVLYKLGRSEDNENKR